MKKIVIINGSPNPNSISNTYQALVAYNKYLEKKYAAEGDELKSVYFKLPGDLRGCNNCKTCSVDCNLKDGMQEIMNEIADADFVMIGSPVYLDMPTAQTVAFLTRLNCKAENTNREFFKGKKALLVATAYCSGTKSVIHTMMGACEMLGFDIDGRSSREYISSWHDKKLRGGMNSKTGAIYLSE
jgi:multimeric flavodoxin WrbA